jgi:16S rRNA (guanine966-N2)-methyltransferase
MIRITGGALKGHNIDFIKTSKTRPTTSMLRQAFFNILQAEIEGSYFLDLFAGSGIMGIEALSRSAKKAVFVEKERRIATLIEKNLAKLDLKNRSKVICKEVFKALPLLKERFDFIYVDPPYRFFEKKEFLAKLLGALKKEKLLKPPGKLFIEMPANLKQKLKLEEWTLKEERKYGSSLLMVIC